MAQCGVREGKQQSFRAVLLRVLTVATIASPGGGVKNEDDEDAEAGEGEDAGTADDSASDD